MIYEIDQEMQEIEIRYNGMIEKEDYLWAMVLMGYEGFLFQAQVVSRTMNQLLERYMELEAIKAWEFHTLVDDALELAI